MTSVRGREFVVPDLGEGLADAIVVTWNVAVGDDVELNQPLCCLETAKAQVEIPSPYAGRVLELGGAEGDTLAVGALLVRIDTAPAGTTDRPPVLVGYGADDGCDTSRRARRPRAAPAVRKLAADLHVNLEGLRAAAGGDGIITRQDVLAAARSADVLPVGGVRARMAERMTLSRKEIPDAHASVQVDGTALLHLHESAPGRAVSVFALVLRLLVVSLQHHPVLNSTWVNSSNGPGIQMHPAVNLGFAVATDRGLLVPVVTDAHELTTRELAERVTDLTDGARNGTLTPAELWGSTFTVSNFGALGLDDGVPVINYPEAAILGMGALRERAVVVDGVVTAQPTMTLTCVFDHRVADGAEVAGFLCELRELLENPATALVDM